MRYDKEYLNDQILIHLEAFFKAGQQAKFLLHQLKANPFPSLSEPDLERQLKYLEGKNLVEQRHAVLSHGTVRWHITSAGIDYLEGKGLV